MRQHHERHSNAARAIKEPSSRRRQVDPRPRRLQGSPVFLRRRADDKKRPEHSETGKPKTACREENGPARRLALVFRCRTVRGDCEAMNGRERLRKAIPVNSSECDTEPSPPTREPPSPPLPGFSSVQRGNPACADDATRE
ncbi:hypothetical protein LX36DRAFT_159474 [Colletotrichum falcatum]|nr:hypothetical protein LX36DRAFT_159474 [Colletotrichum falcatum]